MTAESDWETYRSLMAERVMLEQRMQEFAWSLTPDDLKKIICGKNGLYPETEKDKATQWLIRPNRGFGNQCPIELILKGEREKFAQLLVQSIHGIYI